MTTINATTGAIVGTKSVGTYPLGICFDGTCVWVVNQTDQTVTKINATTRTTIGTYSINGGGGNGICFDGVSVWVAAGGGVTRLNINTGANMGNYTASSSAISACFDGANVWIGNLGDTTVSKF